MAKPRTVGELRRTGYQVLSVKEEMRKNLIARLREGGPLFPGIIGYDDTVIPQVENAILSGQDIIADNTREEWTAVAQARDQVLAHLFFDRQDLISGAA